MRLDNKFTVFVRQHLSGVAVALLAVSAWFLLFLWSVKINGNFNAAPRYIIFAGMGLYVSIVSIKMKHIPDNLSKNISDVKISHTNLISFEVTSSVSDTAAKYVSVGNPKYIPNALGLNYDPGNIEKLFVSIGNNTGESIAIDDSYILEKRVSKKWYGINMLEDFCGEFAGILLAPGMNEHICFSALGRYDTLENGYYRIIKGFPTKDGEIILAAEFMIG